MSVEVQEWPSIRRAYRQRRWKEALHLLRRACSGRAGADVLWRWLAQVLIELKQYHKGDAILRRYLRVRPKDWSAWYWRADVAEDLEKYGMALRHIRYAIRLDPGQWHYWDLKLNCLMNLRQWESALKACAVTQRLGKREGLVYHGKRAEILYRLKRYTDAWREINAAIAAEGSTPHNTKIKAAIEARWGR